MRREKRIKGYIYIYISAMCGRRGFEKIFLLLIEGYIYFYFSAIDWRRGEGLVLLIDEKAAELDHNQVEELHPLGKPSKKKLPNLGHCPKD